MRRWRPPELPGVEVVSVHAEDYVYPRLTLDGGYTIKITRTVPPPVRYRGRDETPSAADGVTVIEPDEVVRLLDASATTADYRVLMVEPEFLSGTLRSATPPRFRHLAYPDKDLFNAIASFHGCLAHREDSLTVQSMFTELLDGLVSRHATVPGAAGPMHGPLALRRVREVLHDRLDANIGLDELAVVAGCSKHHLIRSFQHAYGAPPHRYRTLLRLARARSMLAAGRSVADVAADLGYFDQSQLNRHFRRVFGTSAGSYARAVR